jgi:hypothetical protein
MLYSIPFVVAPSIQKEIPPTGIDLYLISLKS